MNDNVKPVMNYTPPSFAAASSSAAGGPGEVPAPAQGQQTSFLMGNGSWQKLNITYKNYTLAASGWSNKQYAGINTAYPASTYDIDLFISGSATMNQVVAFSAAQVGGSFANNILVARGIQPTIDIPVVLRIMTKFPEIPGV